MTTSEQAAYNAGVSAMMEAAERSAQAMAATTCRPLHEVFAVVALDEPARAGRELLVYQPGEAKGSVQVVLPEAA